MKNPAISIIVPVYNMERYLKECLLSIKDQTFSDWECIIVNDGSFDTSPTVIREITRYDSRFKIINKENGGLSIARNVAMKIATGDYIAFIDSDDWIEPTMYERLYQLITEYDADIAQISFWEEYTNERHNEETNGNVKVIDGNAAMIDMGYGRLPRFVWNKLHRREIITCDFPIGRNFEDLYVYGQWLKNVRRMVIDSTPMYHYRMRKSSIRNIEHAKNRYDYFLSCIDRMNIIQDSMKEPMNMDRRDAYLNKEAVKACEEIAREEKNSMKRDGAIARIRDDVNKFSLPAQSYLGSKYWWYAKMLRSNSKFFSMFVRFSDIFHSKDKNAKAYLFE